MNGDSGVATIVVGFAKNRIVSAIPGLRATGYCADTFGFSAPVSPQYVHRHRSSPLSQTGVRA
jgi:hypothetical protein